MEKKFWYGSHALRHAGRGGLALLAAGSLLACGSDDSTGPARVHIPSSIVASAAGCGTVVVGTGTAAHDVQTYNLSATWQATGTWKAVFVDVGSGNTWITDVDASQTKTSVIRDEDGVVTDECEFKAGDVAYAILFPDGDAAVQSDADLTPTITVGS